MTFFSRCELRQVMRCACAVQAALSNGRQQGSLMSRHMYTYMLSSASGHSSITVLGAISPPTGGATTIHFLFYCISAVLYNFRRFFVYVGKCFVASRIQINAQILFDFILLSHAGRRDSHLFGKSLRVDRNHTMLAALSRNNTAAENSCAIK